MHPLRITGGNTGGASDAEFTGMVGGTNDKAAGNTASSLTVRHNTQELQGWCFYHGGEGCRQHGRAGHSCAAALFRHAPWTLR